MYEYNKMNISGTDINVKDSTARETAGSALTEAENASGIATEALTGVREHSVKFASLEATTAAQATDIATLKSKVGTGTLNTTASTLIPAMNEVNNKVTDIINTGLTSLIIQTTTEEGTTTGTGALPTPVNTNTYAILSTRCLSGTNYFAMVRGDNYFTCFKVVDDNELVVAANETLTFEVTYARKS